MTDSDHITGIFVGEPRELRPGRDSAIDKHPVTGPVSITPLGLAGDHQADRINHGGPERALLHYSARHYAVWRAELADAPGHLLQPPGFGENISSPLLDETQVCIGDVYRLGTARVQVSQPRSPCWKLNVRFGVDDLARRVQDTQRCGWLYRVLDPGEAATGDTVRLEDRPHPGFSVARVMRAAYCDPPDPDLLARIAALEGLSANWRAKARRRLTGAQDDPRARLQGDST